MTTNIEKMPAIVNARMKSELKRQNRFWVAFPDSFQGGENGKQAKLIENAVKASARPQFQVSEQTIHHLNTPWYLAGKPTWATWSCTFYDFQDDNTLQALVNWYKKVYDFGTGEMGLPTDYKKDVFLYILDNKLNPDRATDVYKLVNCWPLTLDTGTLSMDSDGTPLEVAVTFRFDYVTFNDTADMARSAFTGAAGALAGFGQ